MFGILKTTNEAKRQHKDVDAAGLRKLNFKPPLNSADQSDNTLRHIQRGETRGWRLYDIKSLKHILKLIRSDRDQMKNLKGVQGTGPGIDFFSLPRYFQEASRTD